MNEQMIELAKQAGLKFPSETELSPAERKFAELIVRECATVVISVTPCFGDYRDQIEVNMRDHCAKKVMEHFGVK